MNNILPIKSKSPTLEEVNKARAAHGHSLLKAIHNKWNFAFSPLLTLEDFAKGSRETRSVAASQSPLLAEIDAKRKKEAKVQSRMKKAA